MEETGTSFEASVDTVPPRCAASAPAQAPALKRRPCSAAWPPSAASVPLSGPAPPPHHTAGPPGERETHIHHR